MKMNKKDKKLEFTFPGKFYTPDPDDPPKKQEKNGKRQKVHRKPNIHKAN